MRFAHNKASELALKKAAAAVFKNERFNRGFTMIEVMVVILIIGILASLAYSNLMDLIFTNRAKETAQTIRTFAERALSEGKRLNDGVTIKINNNVIQFTTKNGNTTQEQLSGGFSGANVLTPTCENVPAVSFNSGAVSKLNIGISGIALEEGKDKPAKTEGYFVACDSRKNYCGAAVKVNGKNSFVACIKKPNRGWEDL